MIASFPDHHLQHHSASDRNLAKGLHGNEAELVACEIASQPFASEHAVCHEPMKADKTKKNCYVHHFPIF